MGEMRFAYKILYGKTEGKRHLESVDRMIILKWNFGK
jgi:hypothetical protein